MPEGAAETLKIRSAYGLLPLAHKYESSEAGKFIFRLAEEIIQSLLNQLASGSDEQEVRDKLAEDLCRVLEMGFCHGAKRSAAFWEMLELGRKRDSELHAGRGQMGAVEMISLHYDDLPNRMARLRAWIRLSLLKRTLVCEVKQVLRERTLMESAFCPFSLCLQDSFGSLLEQIDQLAIVDFGFDIKKDSLDLSPSPVEWDRFVSGMASLTVEAVGHEEKDVLRVMGRLEDENARMRRVILKIFSENTRLERKIHAKEGEISALCLQTRLLESEVERLSKQNYRLNELVATHELTNQALLDQFNKM